MGLAIVQAASNAYKYDGTTTAPTIKWSTAPTNGNLLIVCGFAWQGATIVPDNGWAFIVPPQQGTPQLQFAMFKYASSEPTTDQVDSSSHLAFGLNAWEISGVTGNFWQDFCSITLSAGSQQGPSTSITPGSLTTHALTTIALTSLVGYTLASGQTFAWSGGPSIDAQFNTTHADASNGLFDYGTAAHQVVSGATAINPTITASGGSFWFYSMIEVGFIAGPGIDILSLQQAEAAPATNTALTSIATPSMSESQFPAVIMVIVNAGCFENASPPTPPFVSSVSGLGLTWNLRGRDTYTNGSQVQQEIAVYWAHTTAPVSGAVTATLSGLSGSNNFFAAATIQAFAILGLANPTSPFDPNGSLPNFSGLPGSLTTTNAHDLTIASAIVTAANNSSLPSSTGFDWTNFSLIGVLNGGGAVIASSATSWGLAATALSSLAVTTTGGSGAHTIYLDALGPSASSAPVTAVGAASGVGAAAAPGTGIARAVGSAAGHGSATSLATGIFPATGRAAGIAGVIGVGNVLGVLEPLFDWEATVISQYQTSPTLLQLIENMETYIDPLTNLDAFYVDIWNIYSASGYGLDVWGRIVGVTRTIRVPTPTKFLGFESAAPSVESYDFGILFDGSEALTQNYTLSDQAFRTLILAKALANICNGSIPAMNQILINLFNGKGYGNVYVTDGEDMTMTITFTNAPSAVDLAIISTSGVFPRPAGVDLSVVT